MKYCIQEKMRHRVHYDLILSQFFLLLLCQIITRFLLLEVTKFSERLVKKLDFEMRVSYHFSQLRHEKLNRFFEMMIYCHHDFLVMKFLFLI